MRPDGEHVRHVIRAQPDEGVLVPLIALAAEQVRDRVAFRPHPELVQAMYATWRLGAVLAPTNARLHDDDIVVIAMRRLASN